MRAITITALMMAALLSPVGPRPAAAQTAEDDLSPPLVGRVVDAADGSVLAGAEVLLFARAAEEDLAAIGDERARERALASGETDAGGEYRFEAIPAGLYLLRVSRLGYRTVTVQVRAGGERRSAVSVALEIQPIALEPLAVDAPGESIVRGADGRTMVLGRIPAERLRQDLHLASDARVVSAPELREAATLGEIDVLRAIQRLPGVSTRDDFTAELWTRGASWGETRLYLDGLPLFNPVHGLGVLTGMSHRGLATALFQPGIRTVRLPEGSAAVLDLVSSSGAGTGEWTGGADVTLASVHGWGRGPWQDGEGGWSLTARRSWVDLAAAGLSDRAQDEVPYTFTDVLGRVDVRLGDGVLLSASGLAELDDLDGDIPDILHGTAASWGNLAGQATLVWPMRGLLARQSVGATTYRARVRTVPSRHDDDFNAPSEPPADHDFVHATLRGELAPPHDGWRIGYDLVHQSAEYEGPQAWPYSQRPPDLPGVRTEADLTRLGVWGRTRRTFGETIEVEGSLRVDGGSSTVDGRLELQPSLMVRWNLAPDASVSAGVARYVQYAQSPAPVGPRIEQSFESGRLWVLADELQAPLRASIATLGGEIWLGDAWLASATVYARRSQNVLLPDATEGLLVQRPPLVPAEVLATGLELGVRRLAGRITGSVGYSLGNARADALGVRFPAPTDRRHTIDITAHARLARWMSASAAYTFATGSPYARTLLRCVGTEPDCRVAAYLDRPFQRRSDAYSSLDLVLDWTRTFEDWSLGFFLQARNLLGGTNEVTYTGSEEHCAEGVYLPDQGHCSTGLPPRILDRFASGMPTLPLIGFRVVF